MSNPDWDGGPAFPCSYVGTDLPHEGIGGGMSIRDYFIAHAPPLPAFVINAYIESVKINEPEAVRLPWNEFLLKKLAVQEARWREQYADELLAQRAKADGK